MDGRSAEVAREQVYFDTAAAQRDRKRAALEATAGAGAHAGAAAHLQRYAQTAGDALGDADSAVAFGRIDHESGERLYIGKHLIRGDDAQVLVVNWRSPAAAPYFEASHADPAGLRRKRTFTCKGNTIRGFTDVLFAAIAAAIGDGVRAPAGEPAGDGSAAAPAGGALVDQPLLDALARGRTGSMRDIVATIQTAQYEVIRAPLEQLLVIEGGPGTGKTAVALHRVSWLLYQHRDRLTAEDVLVVGPHPTFMRYLSEVLPGLGDDRVVMRDLGQLAPAVPRGRAEPPQVSRLKGEQRMAGLVARALAARVGYPEPAERLLLGGRFLTLSGVEVAEALSASQAASGLPYAARREQLRQRLAGLIRDRGGDPAAAGEALTNLLERLWPAQSAAALLRDLFGSRRRLRVAAAEELTDEERELLYRRGVERLSQEQWSAADLPLLDEAEHLIHGSPRQYAHVVLDEAQDLSPMQLRSVARRSATGSLTLVGDLAQSTGPWARERWQEVTDQLPAAQPVVVAPLRYGYRVPRQVYELAARLLPVAAPHVSPPAVVRDGPAEPVIHRVELTERAGRVVSVATGHARQGQFVGIVCPDRCRREVEAALADNRVEWSSAERGELGAAINLVSPHEAKGLEFDAVVVVEPEQIVAADPRGHRLLYVALTRTTQLLDIVCVGEPVPLAVPAAPRPRPPADPPLGFGDRDVERLADHLAGRLRSAAPPAAWPRVLDAVARRLDLPAREPGSGDPGAGVRGPGDPGAGES